MTFDCRYTFERWTIPFFFLGGIGLDSFEEEKQNHMEWRPCFKDTLWSENVVVKHTEKEKATTCWSSSNKNYKQDGRHISD